MWEARGIRGGGEPPPLLSTHGGDLLVVGGGRCVWGDLAGYDHRGDVLVVNDIGAYLERGVTHWASLHPEYLSAWWALRVGHNIDNRRRPLFHSNKPGGLVDQTWDLENTGALSGLFGALIGLCMGYDRIILAGCPCDGSGRFFDPPGQRGEHADQHIRIGWESYLQNCPEVVARVRSLSGWTRHVMGAP